MSESKRELRRAIRACVRALTPSERALASGRVAERLIECEQITRSGLILGYLALPDEVDIDPFLKRRLADNLAAGGMCISPVKGVATPRVNWEERRLTPVRLVDFRCVSSTGRFGLREPRKDAKGPNDLIDEAASCADIDGILVPGVAFDRNARRLGRGGGFYDRFLDEYRRVSDGWVVGVAFDEQIVPEVPMDEHDIPLDAVVTPSGWIGAV